MKNLSLLLFITISIFSCKKERKTNSEEKSNKEEIVIETKLEKLAGDFIFTEGPAADAEGNVYFTDIPENKIYKWTVDDKLEVFQEETGGANGLYFDADGNLLICEGREGLISSIDPEGNYTQIATTYNGNRFNQPNDLWADGNGGVYFTDPKYSDDLQLPQNGMHVFYIHPDRTEVTRVCDDLVKPNGIIGSLDGKVLYVTDPGASKTYKYDIKAEGSLANKTLFLNVGGDGMTIDTEGNIYLTTDGKKAIDVFSKEGELIDSIAVPEQPSNVSFGGKDLNELYITARTSLYRVEVNKKGMN